MPLRKGPPGFAIIENLREYKLRGKQVGLLSEGDYHALSGRSLSPLSSVNRQFICTSVGT
jgi:hypothetical protein